MVLKKVFQRKERPTAGVQCSIVKRGDSFTTTSKRKQYDWVSLPRNDDAQSRDDISIERGDAWSVARSGDDRNSAEDLYMSERAEALPKLTGRFGNNHLLINIERIKRNIKPLVRDHSLDAIALDHAKEMAAADQLHHSGAQTTIAEILRASGPFRLIGENVTKQGRGTKYLTSLAHRKLFANSSADKRNMLDLRYTLLGVGSEVSDTGIVYICQIYKG